VAHGGAVGGAGCFDAGLDLFGCVALDEFWDDLALGGDGEAGEGVGGEFEGGGDWVGLLGRGRLWGGLSRRLWGGLRVGLSGWLRVGLSRRLAPTGGVVYLVHWVFLL
jgi:hypothetical protein